MNVIVLGSGVIGTTTAWYLAQRSARVTVIDHNGAALETSYANTGQVARLLRLAAPGIPLKAEVAVPAPRPLAIRADGNLFQGAG